MENNNYEKKLKNLKTKLSLVLDELIYIYPYYKTYENNNNYKNIYNNDISNLEKTKSDFFILKNDIQKNIKLLEKEIYNYNLKNNKYKKDNKVLTEKNSSLIDSSNGSNGLYYDSQSLYKITLINNWLLIIIVIIFIIYFNI